MDIQGIDNHQITDVPMITAGDVLHTQRVPVIVILHQYDYIDYGEIIYSSGQLESFNFDVNNKYIKVNGELQRIKTQEDVTIPLDIISGLSYVNLRTYTDKE